MGKHTRKVMMTVLVILSLLLTAIIAPVGNRAEAFWNPAPTEGQATEPLPEPTTETTEPAEPTPAPTAPLRIDEVRPALMAWNGTLHVSEVAIGPIDALRILVLIDEPESPSPANLSELSALIEEESKKTYFTYNRIYVDTINSSGERVESVDIIPATLESRVASFPLDAQRTGEEQIKALLNEPFKVGPYTLTIREVYYDQRGDNPHTLYVTFDFMNNSANETSVFWALDVTARDGDEEYELDYDIFSGKIMDSVAPGETVTGVNVFFLVGESKPLTVYFKEFLSDAEPVAFDVMPGVG